MNQHPMERVIPGRSPAPDVRYSSRMVEKLINYITRAGKKSAARKIVYAALDTLKERTGEHPLEVFYKAINNIMPKLETRSQRIGGSSYQVPYEVPEERQRTLALRWVVEAARKRREKSMSLCLAAELLDALKNQGEAIKKREDTHRMAESNRAFAHYRW